jgi:hypothetical protein
MKKNNALIIIGIVTLLIPLSGIPKGWKYFFTMAAGAAVTLIAIFLRRESLPSHKASSKRDAPSYARTYIENNE